MTEERQNEIWAMLPPDFKKFVRDWYKDVIDNNEPHEHIFEGLFGKHNLTAQAEEKPKEPRFKVGDKVIAGYSLRIVLKINQVENIYRYFITDINGEAVWYDEDELTPYTEPKVDGEISNKKSLLDRVIDAGYNFLDRHNPDVIPERGISNIDYTRYRLDLAKEIAVSMIAANLEAADIPHDAVKNANEIVKRLKETEE